MSVESKERAVDAVVAQDGSCLHLGILCNYVATLASWREGKMQAAVQVLGKRDDFLEFAADLEACAAEIRKGLAT